EQGRADRGTGCEGREVERERLDRGGPANPARRRSQERTLRTPTRVSAEVDVDVIRFHEIVGDRHPRLGLLRLGADAYASHVVERTDDLLSPEKSERELQVIARRPHSDG